MGFCRVRDKLSLWLAGFGRASGGNAVMLFGLTATVVLTAAGGAIDFARAVDARTRMAAALDAAALAVGSSSKDLSTSQMQSLAQKYFDANYSGNMVNTPGAVQISAAGNMISLSVSGTMPTTLLKLAGINTLQLGVDNEVTRAHMPKKMQVVLALDNTGSMALQGRMDALKTATHNLLDTLEDAVEADGDVRVGIVPFAREVNVGPGNYTQTWIKWDDWDANNGSDQTTTTCTGTGKKKKCTTTTSWVPNDHSTWDGCVMDRDQSYDTQNTAPSAATPATLFWAHQSDGAFWPADECPTQLQTLTTNWSTLHAKVDDMTPAGFTNTTIGLVWAWQALTNSLPLSAPAADPDSYKIIIFMTDGDNTLNRWSWTPADIDDRMELTCDNVKDAGIILYTVLMIEGNEALLQDCASDDNKFFKVTASNQLVNVFEAIGNELSNLHISK
jgi:Flp pilus assembly protein TadG